jgi:hypothetical protein
MPYQPFDTGWIKSLYSMSCLIWFLVSTGLLPRFAMYSIHNTIYNPFSTMVMTLCDFIANIGLSIGTGFVHLESITFHKFDYVKPIYNVIKYLENLIPPIDRGRPPSFQYPASNVRLRKTSSGKHLSSYFARKRRCRLRQIIFTDSKYYFRSKNNKPNTSENPKFTSATFDYDSTYHPIDDPSCHDDRWYDAITPYWTGGMVWGGAYVLGHQVVSANTDPIFVSDLPPGFELSATIQTPEVRSEGENVDLRTSIALDSGSSIHIFKDSFLLTAIAEDESQSIRVRTTDSKFKVNEIGRLCDDLQTLPLPSDGYYYYPNGVANLLSLAMIAKTKRVVMDTAIDDAFYVFNDDGTYIRFARTANGMYCININVNDDDTMVMAHQTVEGESAKYSNLDCRRAEKIRDLQEILACPSDFDLANAVENNVIGNNPFTRRDIRIAKQIYGPDVPAMKAKTVKSKSKMPREDEITDLPINIIKEYSDVHLSIDVMHVNGIKFLISYSKHIGLLQTYCVRKNNRETILDCISKMMKEYRSRNIFRVITIEYEPFD